MDSLIANYQIIGASALLVIIIFLFIIVFKCKKVIDKKNMQLMQLYMELNFLYKNINHSITNESRVNFCSRLIDSIKEYYNLEDLVVADSVELESNGSTVNSFKNTVYDFLVNNEPRIKKLLKEADFATQILEILEKKYILYIFPIDLYTSNSGFIMCIETYPSLLSKSELMGLKGNIGLLRAKLLSD